MKRVHRFLLSAVCAAGLSGAVHAATVEVNQLGDQGWKSDDTRDAAGVNLVGVNTTNAGKPGQTATLADDAAIATQIQIVNGPAGSTYGGAVSIDGTSGNSGKSNISAINTGGFDSAANLLLPTFGATYEWYGQPNPTSRTLAFKLGIQSSDWTNSQASFTAQRSGESAWDLVLVHIPSASDNAWSTVNLDHATGNWLLFRQAGNGYFTDPIPGAQTLDSWNTDGIWGPRLFGAGAKVTSVQFGLGSSQRQSIAYVDYLQTNLLNGGDVVDFTPVPLPAAAWMGMSIVGGIGSIRGLKRLRRKSH